MTTKTTNPRSSERPFSQTLRRIGELIQQRDFPAALAEINEAALDESLTDAEKSRLTALSGDCEFKQGYFEQADDPYYSTAYENGADHVRLWLRPLIGRVRSLLKSPDVNAARNMADVALAKIQEKVEDFEDQVRESKQILAETGSVQVPMAPQPVSAVATRLGNLFLQEGEPEHAKHFFEQALAVNKYGACRARQGLAKVALAKGEYKEAIVWATDSIRRGKYRAKTISAWPILIAARSRATGGILRAHLISELFAIEDAGVRARAVLVIVRELRKNNIRQWLEIANQWMTSEGEDFPRVAKEIQKLLLSSAKAAPGNTAGIRTKAQELLQMPVLGPREWLAGARELVRTSLLDNVAVDFNLLIATAQGKYGGDFDYPARHGLALACIAAGNTVQARALLEANIPEASEPHPPGSQWWAKSVWALARLESQLENHGDAAARYQQYFEAPNIPKRLCLQAQLEWVKELIADGDSSQILAARTKMEEVLQWVSDPEIRMNFARQLQFGPPELKSWGQTLFTQAATDAMTAFAAADHPAVAMNILFKLTRRQVWDFGRSADAVATWESLDAETQDWLWSGSSVFWEYLGLVFEAYASADDFAGAEAFANGVLNDIAVPADGLPYVGVPFARQLIRRGRIPEGLALFERLAQSAPRHAQCALAWYWLAIAALQQENVSKSKEYAACIRQAQNLKTGLSAEYRLDAKALLLLADLNPASVDPAAHYKTSQLNEYAQQINADLNWIAP